MFPPPLSRTALALRVLSVERLEAESYVAAFDTAGLPSGVYLVRLVAGNRVATQRVTVLR
jgi:hypothetical protein